MWKYVIADYFRAYKWGNVKQAWKATSGTSFSILALLVASGPILFDTTEEMVGGVMVRLLDLEGGLWTGVVLFFAYFVPMIFIWFSSVVHPVRLPKMMFLCPMGEEERRAYVYHAFRFRIIFSMSIALAGLLVIILFFGFDWIEISAFLFNDFVLCMILPAWKEKDLNSGGFFEQYEWSRDMEVALKIFLAFAVMIFAQVFMVFLTNPGMSVVAEVILFMIMLAFEIPMFRGNLKYVRRELAAAVCYEDACREAGITWKSAYER